MLSIHINLSAGAQNITGDNNYASLQAFVNNCLPGKNACKQQKLFVQGYNLEVHYVIKVHVIKYM